MACYLMLVFTDNNNQPLCRCIIDDVIISAAGISKKRLKVSRERRLDNPLDCSYRPRPRHVGEDEFRSDERARFHLRWSQL